MEIEPQRKIILLENSVKDIEERLAELYRETAGLSLQKSTVLQQVKRDAGASRKHATEVKRIHSELKSGLDEVSTKLARMDMVIRKLNLMRREARKEKSEEVSELASSLLKLNKKVSKIDKLVEEVRAGQHDPRIDVLQREVSELKKLTAEKPSKMVNHDMGAALSRLEELIDQKVGTGQLQDALGDVSAALSSEMESLQKNLSQSLEKFESRLAKVDGLSGAQSDLSRSFSSLEKQLQDMRSSISRLSKGAKAGVASPIDTKKIDELGKKIETVRERANSILKEIYDSVDTIKSAHASHTDELDDTKKKLSILEKKVKMLPRASVGDDSELDLSGLVAEVEELREYVDTLVKGLEVSKALTEEMKNIESKLSAMEDWRARMTDFPRELERLAERLAELETARIPEHAVSMDLGRTETDMKNLKMTVAELSNKLDLINTLALENQKLQHRIFVLEDKLQGTKAEGDDN